MRFFAQPSLGDGKDPSASRVFLRPPLHLALFPCDSPCVHFFSPRCRSGCWRPSRISDRRKSPGGEIVTPARLKKLWGHATLPPILRDDAATEHLFTWLSQTFNGDMFPPASIKHTPGRSEEH